MWVSNNIRNWDIAAMAVAVQEAGGVVQLLDGQPVDWKVVRIPPIVSAAGIKILENL